MRKCPPRLIPPGASPLGDFLQSPLLHTENHYARCALSRNDIAATGHRMAAHISWLRHRRRKNMGAALLAAGVLLWCAALLAPWGAQDRAVAHGPPRAGDEAPVEPDAVERRRERLPRAAPLRREPYVH